MRTTTTAMAALGFVGLSMVIPTFISAQSDIDLIEEALLPLPVHLRDAAGIVVPTGDGLRFLRPAETDLVCRPDGASRGFRVLCVHGIENRAVTQAFRRYVNEGASRSEAWAAVEAAIGSGDLTVPRPGAMAYFQTGPNRAESVQLTIIYMPYATTERTGLPTEPTTDGAWLMCPGRPNAHIMLGSEPYGVEGLWRDCLEPAG